MISKLAVRLTNYLYSEGTISAEDKELYQYGFFLLFSRIMFLLVTLFVGLAANVFWESLLFYVMFSVLRGYAGGVHASSEFACDILSTGTFIISVSCIRIMKYLDWTSVAVFLTIIGGLIILIFAPMDTDAKSLKDTERRYFRKVCIILTILYISLAVIFMIIKVLNLLYTISICVALEAVLLLIEKIRQSALP